MTSFFLGYNIATGAGLSFNSSTNVLSNSGVLSLQGDTGKLSLAAGTGISISGLTISNSGLISASAGDGISVSGTDPLTITNSGVLSLQGDTGALSLVAGTGIGISGLTITNDGVTSLTAGTGISLSGSSGDITVKVNTGDSLTWSAVQTFEPYVYFYGNSVAYGYLNDQSVFSPNNSAPFTTYHDYSGELGAFFTEIWNYGALGLINKTSTAISNIPANSFMYSLFFNVGGGVYTSGTTGSLGSGGEPQVRNTLDNGSGDMSIAGTLSVTGEISGGSYNLTGGTGISFSGVTITNTGIISASAGDGITVSGTNPLTIGMSGSYSGNMTVGGLTQIPNGLEDSTVDTPAAPSQALFHNFTTNDITGARWSMHNGYYRWNLAQETTTAGTFQDILSIDTGQSPGVGSDIYFRALDTSLPLHFVSFPSYSFDNSLSVAGGTFTINESVSTTAATYLDTVNFAVNAGDRFYFQIYASEGKTSSTDGDYWFVGWAATGNQLLKVHGSGNMNVAGVITSGNKVTYTSGSGTFTVPSGISMLKVYLIGAGGGGGGGSDYNTTYSASGGGGGGGGGAFISLELPVNSGQGISYSVGGGGSGGATGTDGSNGGTGGATHFGGFYANGGSGGSGAGSTSNGAGGSGGSGGSYQVLNEDGGAGEDNPTVGKGGSGGGSYNGFNYGVGGAGGNGGTSANHSGNPGDTGGDGAIIIYMS